MGCARANQHGRVGGVKVAVDAASFESSSSSIFLVEMPMSSMV